MATTAELVDHAKQLGATDEQLGELRRDLRQLRTKDRNWFEKLSQAFLDEGYNPEEMLDATQQKLESLTKRNKQVQKKSRQDRPAPVWHVLKSCYNFDDPSFGEPRREDYNDDWHNKLECPKCQTDNLSVLARANGTGQWLCHECGFRSKAGDTQGFKKWEGNNKLPEHTEKGINLKPLLGTTAALARLTGSTTRAVVIKQLVYWAEKMKWKEFYKTDAELRSETGASRWQVLQTKKWANEQPWAKLWCRGIGNKTWYRFDRRAFAQALTGQDTAPDQRVRRKRRSVKGGEV